MQQTPMSASTNEPPSSVTSQRVSDIAFDRRPLDPFKPKHQYPNTPGMVHIYIYMPTLISETAQMYGNMPYMDVWKHNIPSKSILLRFDRDSHGALSKAITLLNLPLAADLDSKQVHDTDLQGAFGERELPQAKTKHENTNT